MRAGVLGFVGLLALVPGGAALAQQRTLQDALSAAYANNPTLQAARAQLRATDEGVPQALSGWRPTITVAGALGYGDGTLRTASNLGTNIRRNNRDVFTEQATLTQPLYRGGATRGGD